MAAERIMIVEDEHIVALDIRKQIERFGYEIAGVFSSGEAALAGVQSGRPDLVLMDIRLNGDLDGIRTAEKLREEHNIPVVILTAFADQATLDRAKLSQPYAYIVKPFEENELRTAVVNSLYRHQMEQIVVQRERLFSTTLESIVDAVIVTDEQGRMEFLNPVAQSLLDLESQECLGAALSEVAEFHVRPVADPGRDSKPETAEIRTEVPAREGNGEFDVVTSAGRTVAVAMTISQLTDSAGVSRGRVYVMHDISSRLQAEEIARAQNERLRQSRKMEAIGRLTGGIAHDFNNLLTVILGYSRLIIDEIDGGTTARESIVEDVEGIQKAALRSAALTRQLLSFGRDQSVERRPTDLNETVIRMEAILRQLLKDDVTLTLDPTGEKTVVFADPSQLEQVVMNLAVNARDAMPEGGRLLVRTERRRMSLADVIGRDEVSPGEFVVLTVADNGSGMDQSTLDRVFDPFFTTKGAGKGTGLGLSTVYGIVSQSHGFVDVASRPGEGTTFTVCLPAHRADDAGDEPSSGAAHDDTGTETILLVEDDESIRTLISRLLRQKGYRVLEASNAGEALLHSETESGEIQLLLSDVVMPLMSGIKLAVRLRETRADIRVILMSGYPDTTVPDEEREALGLEFLRKPVEPGTLTATVRSILDG